MKTPLRVGVQHGESKRAPSVEITNKQQFGDMVISMLQGPRCQFSVGTEQPQSNRLRGIQFSHNAGRSKYRAANWPKCEDGSASLARLGLALSADPEESYELSKAWASVLTGGRGDIPFAALHRSC